MEKEFTSDDFAKMQQQAIRRVKEMQQRSKDREKSETASHSDKSPEKQPEPPSPKLPKLQIKKENDRPRSMLSSLLSMDSDISLILPLLLLLSKEGTDDMLLLALLYIMS